MTSVTEQILEVLRASGLNTIFGNPGSTELPFLQNYPKDFRYILGLQEASVVAMATGHALLTDQAAIVSLHTTAGTGNAMNAIVTAWHAQAPVILTAGQQDRRQIRTEPLLWGKQAEFVRPYVKWSIEPHRAVRRPGGHRPRLPRCNDRAAWPGVRVHLHGWARRRLPAGVNAD